MTPLPSRALGGTGLRLTEVGFGASTLGNLHRAMSDEDATAAVEQAWGRGVRYFDTAPHYGLGLSERRLGRALAAHPREQYVLSTKVGRLLEPNPTPTELDDDGFVVPGDLHRVWDFSADGVRRSLDESLTRLGVDHVDIAYAHDPDQLSDRAGLEALEALAGLREQGVVRAIGVGTNAPDRVPGLFTSGLADVAMVAGRYTLLEHAALATALEPARANGVAVVVAGVFNSGLLSSPWPGDDARYEYAAAPPATIRRARLLADACRRHGTTLPAAAIAFPLLHPAVAGVVLGMRTVDQVDANLDRYRAGVPDELWDDLCDQGLVDPAAVAAGR
ncbi:MAG: aldo/keto reductase [Cellulomonas sp. 73-145]|mgnify:CR=1 FL=1|uniref:aldo/keto reductase n=1 Tax=Cellulomonas sp. 73-145 TaxID=1895739 RepID=UPI00092C4F95|nr:aldo/keto reductase [Cellulomonas sp. 73-145]MBN9328081.1 aldo/keto reductase [Cellulomonas sp.]OJV59834.1 MAG: aldo/keto reductase [Cellulomonas sp. 73-145]